MLSNPEVLVLLGDRLRLLIDDAFLVLRTFHATAAERERALSSFRACGVLEKAEQHQLVDLYAIVTGDRPRPPFEPSTTFLRERVLEAARNERILVIPGWEESDSPAPTDRTPACPEAKVALQVMAREKELAFEGASYVVLAATSWKEFSHGAGRSFDILRREVAKATILRMSAHAASPDRKRVLAEAAELITDGNVAFGGLFLARRRIERTFVEADEAPVLTPSQLWRARGTSARVDSKLDTLEVLVTDGAGKGLKGIAYQLEAPGKSQKGKTDGSGKMRIGDLVPGNGEITFPEVKNALVELSED